MSSDDEFDDSDDEIFDNHQLYYRYEDSIGEPSVQNNTNADMDNLTNALSRHTISSPSSSSSSSLSTSSSSLDSDIALDTLLDQLARVTRQAAYLLASQDNEPIPYDLVERILGLHPRNTTPRNSWFDESLSSEQPINVWMNAMPQRQGYQRVSPVVAFFIIILMVLSHSQSPFPQ